MKQALWGAVALPAWVAAVAVGLYATRQPDQLAVAVVDAVVAAVALLIAVVGAVLLSGPRRSGARSALREASTPVAGLPDEATIIG